MEAALDHLARALEIAPGLRAWAARDPDLAAGPPVRCTCPSAAHRESLKALMALNTLRGPPSAPSAPLRSLSSLSGLSGSIEQGDPASAGL